MKEVLKETGKIEKIYSSIDLESYSHQSTNILRRELKFKPDSKLIGIIAALSPEKDHCTFIDMAEVLIKENSDFKFLIIGNGKLENSLKAYAAEKNLQNSVYFTGQRNDIYQILPELDVLLLTSIEEGLGSVILDAFASKVPVVATNTGGIPELVIPGETGLLAPVGDYILLAECVSKFIENE